MPQKTQEKWTCGIIAVGTEVTSGQITNTNSSWLAQKLTTLGFNVITHVSVPDQKSLILDAFRFTEAHAQFVFVTGGLGPTTDDFTRDVVAEYLGRKLLFNEDSYRDIEARLAARGRVATHSQKRQCWFPENSTILKNSAGTASAFSLEEGSKKWFILPGPPREIDAIWSEHLEGMLQNTVPPTDRTHLFLWQCKGKPEAEIGEIVEKALAGSGFEIGYRAHHPTIEVKVWVPAARLADTKPWFEKLETALSDVITEKPKR